MGFDNKYPYTDYHELNLDWLLEKVKGIDDRFVALEDAVAALREDLDIQTGRIDAALDAITFIQNHYPAMIASQYDESRQYDPGEIAIYDNELYIALPGETPGPWNGNYWNKTSLGDELGTIIIKVNDIILPDLTNINNVLAEYGTLFDDIVETYIQGSTYVKNQIVKYEDHIYRVMVASTNNPPTDLTDWDPETLANIVTDLLNFWNKIIPEYDETATYNVPDYVIYQGNVYTCNAANVTGAWDGSKWNQVLLTDDIASRLAFMYEMFSTLFGWFASFDDAVTYNIGDVVNYNGTLYECLYDGVTGAWNDSKWQVQKVTDAMTKINCVSSYFNVIESEGNPVGIIDAVNTKAEKCEAVFFVDQEGTGVPTENNYRHIKGRTTISVNIDETVSVNPAITYNAVFDSSYEGGRCDLINHKLYAPSNNIIIIDGVDTKFIQKGSSTNNDNYYIEIQNGNMYGRTSNGWVDQDVLNSAGVKCSVAETVTGGDISISNLKFGLYVNTITKKEQPRIFFPLSFGITTIADANDYAHTLYQNGTPIEISVQLKDQPTIPINITSDDIIIPKGDNIMWSDDCENIDLKYKYLTELTDYTPDDRIVTVGTYSGKRVLQINHFEQGVSLDGSLKSFNILPANAILINAWAYGKGNDDGTMAAMNPWWSTTAGDLCIQASSWASNTTADIWMYAQYVEP